MNEPWTGLADAIEAVRAELLMAREKATSSQLPFELGPVEIQFSVALTREADARAGVKVWVIEASSGGSLTNAATHQIKVTLQARRPDGGPERISRH